MTSISSETCAQELLVALKSLLGSGEYSDLRVCTTERVYHVHRAVICPRSQFFQSACKNGFKEESSSTIELHDDCPHSVDCMINYLYTLDYDDNSAQFNPVVRGEVPEDIDPVINDEFSEDIRDVDTRSSTSNLYASLSLNARVYAMAEKYCIQGLKNVAQVKFSTQLKRTGVEKELLSIVSEVYTSTLPKDRGLRDLLLDVIYDEIQYWTMQEDFLRHIVRCKDFYADVLQHTVEKDFRKLEVAISTVSDPGYCSVCYETLFLRKRKIKKNYSLEKYCVKCASDSLTPV